MYFHRSIILKFTQNQRDISASLYYIHGTSKCGGKDYVAMAHLKL